jgi:uncharacterized protein (DUF885 family)
MKKAVLIFICFITTSYVNMLNAKDTGQEADPRFNDYKERFVLALWQVYPSWAASVGFHKYDDVLIIPGEKSRAAELAFCRANLDSLQRFNPDDLSDANKTDYRLVENQLKYAIWGITDLKAYEWDPSGYNVCGGFSDMLGNGYDALDTRLRSFYVKMAAVPAYYQAAEKNIKDPANELTALAIEQNKGGISVFGKDLAGALQKSGLGEKEKADMKARATQAVEAINAYIDWLKNLRNDHPRSFRLGKELYDKKFAFELQSRFTPQEIFDKAIAHKTELHGKMYDITTQLWPRYFAGKPMPGDKLTAIHQMIERLSNNQVLPDSFQSAIEEQLPKLTAFIKNKDLIYIDPSKPLVVRKEPGYMAGVAGASINAPGPYDKNGNTYYNVGSLEGWDMEKAESYLREYNHYTLQILDIHEAIPGHYTQLVYANRSPSIIKAILGNNAMIEGWAVYAERMMIENGYDGDRGPNSTQASPEMWLMYYKWNLRSTCNTILDYQVHTRDMGRADAMKLLVNEAFQQTAEAEGKWKRVSVTSVQLCCYFTGYTEIYDFRSELMDKMKDKFNLKKFHEKFLGYGSAPVKYIREMMLKDWGM